ncbi:MAG: TetR/AcrR family transcriptional regulator [Sandaracinaceae bacterium]|nr:TetR/AcrR family transcriptional regulator [Sandaracinaceae bacterium]
MTREALRAAAERLFDERGADGVSVRAVADEVGTTTRAVYSLFGSREGLLIDSLAERAYELLDRGLTTLPETDDPAGDLIEAGVTVFRPFVREHPSLFRIAFQRVAPDLEPGPQLVAARARAFDRLVEKIRRLEAAGQLGEKAPTEALIEFQALCEGLGNLELRGDTMRLLPSNQEETTWRAAFTTLVRGFAAR